MSVTKNHSPAMPIPKIGRVIDPAKQRVMNAILYATIGTVLLVVAVIAVSSFLGGFIPPANEPPVIINNPTTEPSETPAETSLPTSEPTDSPTGEPTTEPTIAPTEVPTVAPTTEPTTESTVTSPAPKNFVVPDKYWKNASIIYNSEGAKLWGVGFSDIPVGTKLYSPIDGYLHLMSMSSKQDGSVTLIIISEDEDWVSPGKPGQRYFSFIAKGLDILTVDEIKKGEVFAEVRENAELGGGFYASKVVLIASPDPDWAKMIDDSITDPKEYLITAIKKLN